MPFYIRKSVKAGPFRFNLSKSGVGLSVGVRGLRVGTGPRGHYVHARVGGLYYRTSLGKAGQRRPVTPDREIVETRRDPGPEPGVVMKEIDSDDVMGMRNAEFTEILDELNTTLAKTSFSLIFLIIAMLVAAPISITFWPSGAVSALAAVPALLLGKWLDSYRRRSVLFYNLESNMEAAYSGFTKIVDQLCECSHTWHVSASGDITDVTNWKRNAGANKLIDRKPTKFEYKLPKAISSNIVPPALGVGTQVLFFFPDVILIHHGKRFGAVGYEELYAKRSVTRFIENGKIPRDTQIVGQTWQHPNKSGGPDRRFASNRQIPVCLYEEVHLKSLSGLNELISFSRPHAAEHFVRYLRIVPKTLRPN